MRKKTELVTILLVSIIVMCLNYYSTLSWPLLDDITWHINIEKLITFSNFLKARIIDYKTFSGRFISNSTAYIFLSDLNKIPFFALIFINLFLTSVFLLIKNFTNKVLNNFVIIISTIFIFFPKLITHTFIWSSSAFTHTFSLFWISLFLYHYKKKYLDLTALTFALFASIWSEASALFVLAFLIFEFLSKNILFSKKNIYKILLILTCVSINIFSPGNLQKFIIKNSHSNFQYITYSYIFCLALILIILITIVWKKYIKHKYNFFIPLAISSLPLLFLIKISSPYRLFGTHFIIFYVFCSCLILNFLNSIKKKQTFFIMYFSSILFFIKFSYEFQDCSFLSKFYWNQFNNKSLTIFKLKESKYCSLYNQQTIYPQFKQNYKDLFNNQNLIFEIVD